MWDSPSPGDRFTHPSTPEMQIADRATRSQSTGVRYLWCQGTAFPLAECEPRGVWKALAEAFVQDLERCTIYHQVTALLDGLEPEHRQTIWDITPPGLRASIHRLKTESTSSEAPTNTPPPHHAQTKTATATIAQQHPPAHLPRSKPTNQRTPNVGRERAITGPRVAR